jgi:uncharacterized iron-regulated protein
MRARRLSYLLLVMLAFTPAPRIVAQDRASFSSVDLDKPLALDQLVSQLANKRVVFIGEIHDRYDHHLNQLEIIRRLHERNPDMAIGVEYFQQPFQRQVDGYIQGRIGEQEFLRATEYYQRWGYDYRLYASIFRYAREAHIPVRALNVPTALTSEVARVGIAGLPQSQRTYLPKEIEPADQEYRERLREAFEEHPGAKPGAFDHFVEAQLVWDEGMAESAAAYLNANPDRRMVILCGIGHVEFGSGIPKRLERRTKATYATVINSGEEIEPEIADYLLLSKKQELPAPGVLGVELATKGGECRVTSVTPGGAAAKAGINQGDVLTAINGQPVKTVADVHLALWDKKPGDRVRATLHRRRFLSRGRTLNLDVQLQAPLSAGANASELRERMSAYRG